MEDKSIFKICLIISLVSLFGLFVITSLGELKMITISSIDESNIGEMVKVRGEVEDKYVSKDGHVFFYLENNGYRIKTVVFENRLEDIGLEAGEIRGSIEVVGTVDRYKGEIEILPEDLRRL